MPRRLPILLLVIAAACGRPVPPETPVPGRLDPDELAVYAALIGQDLAHREAVVVADSTHPGTWPRPVSARLGSAATEMEADFRERNRMPVAFPADVGVAHPVRVFAARRDTVLEGGTRLEAGYSVFRWKFLGVPGFYSLSRPGFDAARRHALVTTVYTCGARCGYGDYVLLQRSAEGWRVVASEMTWVW